MSFSFGSMVKLNEEEKTFWDAIQAKMDNGEKVDAHKERAAIMFGVKVEDVTADQRKVGKQRNFWGMYTADFYRELGDGLSR